MEKFDKEVKKKKKREIMTKAATNYINNRLHIENKYASLISLIDTIYPPLFCTLCDTVSKTRIASNIHFKENHKKKSRYLCIHPHCELSFISRGALRFHISRSHLVHHSKKPLPDPVFIEEESCLHTTNETTTTPCLPSPIIHPLIPEPPPIKSTPPTPQQKQIQNITPSLSPPKKQQKIPLPRKEKLSASTFNTILDDLTPSPPPSPFSLYHSKKNTCKKPTLSAKAESFLNSMYPPLQCPACHQKFNRKTNVIKHLTEAHLGEEPYRCIYPKCAHPRLYATREGLVYHLVRAHDEVDQK